LRYFKQNHQITAPEVRLIDEDGKLIGVVTIAEARAKSAEAELDLVEIAPNAKPPVVKIIDYAKFKYMEAKKDALAKKKTRETELKEVRFSPFIGEGDFDTRINRAKEFLKRGDLVKVTVKFKGRQMAHQEFGPKLMEKILVALEGVGEKERDFKQMGLQFSGVVKPAKSAKK
jgi:translation initiation factor IF-3